MEVLVAFLGSGALAAIISGVFSNVAARRATNNGIEAGVQILLYNQLKGLGRKYIIDQHVSTDDLEDYLRMYQVYHALCTSHPGNACVTNHDFLEELVAQVRKLYANN